ncbi:MAG: hypothetical protein E6I93_13990 [Chloroflexi bacterium]|nr:MAG: hypothetical protein E6I93_13990 [Chloroflexota bacterium]
MTEADIQAIVQEVMRRMLAENASSDAATIVNGRATSSSNRQSSTVQKQQADSNTVTVTHVITRSDVVDFAKAGKKRLLIAHGGLVTPLARDLAAEHGIEIVWSSETANGAANKADHTAQTRSLSSSSGKTALTCLRCSSCLEPAFYERALAEMEHSTARVLGELRGFIARCWLHEPADIATLRSISRPPMGNLPCCFYANFNLFWAGENLQVCRQQVKDGMLAVPLVCQMLAGLLERHATRLEKWSMTETVALERMLVQYFKGKGPASEEEFLAVVEHAMIALDRVQSWIDGLLPWSELDARLALRRPITVI